MIVEKGIDEASKHFGFRVNKGRFKTPDKRFTDMN